MAARFTIRRLNAARLGGALALCCIAALGWTAAYAATDGARGVSTLTGKWTNVAADHGRSAIERGVEQAIADMFALARPTARSRLLESNPPIPGVELAVDADRVRVDLGRGRNTSAAPNTWKAAKSVTGDAIRIRYTQLGERGLKMESQSEGGSARHVFQLSEDGSQLKHDVRIESSHLPQDVRYQLNYRRSP